MEISGETKGKKEGGFIYQTLDASALGSISRDRERDPFPRLFSSVFRPSYKIVFEANLTEESRSLSR